MQKQDKDNNFLECYQETLNQMADTFYLKNERYGDSFTQTMDDYGLVTSIIRITDKFNRLTTLYKNKNLDVDDEPIIDTMLDMANYLAMTVAYIKSRKEEDKPDTEAFEATSLNLTKGLSKEDSILWSR